MVDRIYTKASSNDPHKPLDYGYGVIWIQEALRYGAESSIFFRSTFVYLYFHISLVFPPCMAYLPSLRFDLATAVWVLVNILIHAVVILRKTFRSHVNIDFIFKWWNALTTIYIDIFNPQNVTFFSHLFNVFFINFIKGVHRICFTNNDILIFYVFWQFLICWVVTRQTKRLNIWRTATEAPLTR